MAVTKTLLLLILSIYFLSTTITIVSSANEATKTVASTAEVDDDDDDLSFLEEPKPPKDYPDYADPNYKPEGDNGEYGSYEDFKAWDNRQAPPLPTIDEKDVVVLNGSNFGDLVNKTNHVMVEFYAPWCGYCQSLVPEYAAAATELKEGGSDVVVAKVNAIEETALADEYKIEGFPSIFFFSDGKHIPYNGDRTKDAIVSWLKKKTGPAVHNVTTTEEAEKIVGVESKIAVAFVDSLTGSDSKELDAAAKLEDDVNFYQTTSPDVAKIFKIDPKAKSPGLVLLKKEDEKFSQFDGQTFTKSAIIEFVSVNKHPLVINFTREVAELVFENPIKKQLMLFASEPESTKLTPPFQEAAKSFKGKLLFVYVEMDNEDYGKPIVEYFGIVGNAPRILAYNGNEDRRKFFFDGDITLDKIKSFAEDVLDDKLKPYYKSDPIPEINVGDVKIVVGKNFDEIVLDESKDVLLEIYAPWCPHCHELEPTYNRLAKHLRGIDSLIVAKMDGTTNEHPRAKSDGFPTLLFFPAGKKSSDPIIVDTERTAIALYKFLKKHATVPFKIQKPVEAPKSDASEATTQETNTAIETPASSSNIKDEL